MIEAVGDNLTPFTPGAFLRTVGAREDGSEPGFMSYKDTLRASQRDSIFVNDTDQVPKGAKIRYYVPCPLAHPGLCASRDGEALSKAKICADSLRSHLSHLQIGAFFCARFSTSNRVRDEWFASAYRRGAGPRMQMLTRSELYDNSRLRLRIVADVFDDVQEVTFFGAILKSFAPGEDCSNISCYAAPVDLEDQHNVRDVGMYADWADRLGTAMRLFPPPVHVGSSSKHGQKASSAALRLLFSEQRRAEKRRRKPAAGLARAVPLVKKAPRVVEEPDGFEVVEEPEVEQPESEFGSSDARGSLDESSDETLLDEPDDGEVALDAGGVVSRDAHGPRADRGDNDFEHDGLRFTRLRETDKASGVKVLTGYCVHCPFGHVDSEKPWLRCRKDFHFGNPPVPDDVVLRRLVAWARNGHKIAAVVENARWSHVFGPTAKKIRTRTPSP